MFKKHIAFCTVGRYCLLILDDHSSYATAGFDKFCIERNIISLYLSSHLSYLLQPFDVSCFLPLKHLYGQKTEKIIQNRIYLIDKKDFLYIYFIIHQCALSLSNIQSRFAATGLVLLSPERVLLKLHIQLKTSTPPSTAHSNQSFNGPGKTPANIYQLDQQKKQIQYLQS